MEGADARFERDASYAHQCSLCTEYNSLSEQYKDPAGRLERAELNSDFLDFELTQGRPYDVHRMLTSADQPAVPAVLLVVDVTGDKAYLDVVKSGVQAALEGASQAGRFD